jgi:hypothetical protein
MFLDPKLSRDVTASWTMSINSFPFKYLVLDYSTIVVSVDLTGN